LFNRYHIKIHFAHRTFKWINEARGKAAVHVVIIGFSNFDIVEKRIFEYEDIAGEPHEIKVNNINPYLVEGKDLILLKRRNPISFVPEISFGNMPNDNGYLLLDNNEKCTFIADEPFSEKFIKPFLSAKEFINNENRWCLWLKDANPNEFRNIRAIIDRIHQVREYRLKSNREETRKLAAFPYLFGEIRQPNTNYILIPLHSSENRKYIPIGFFSKDFIIGNSCSAINNATLYHFGVLTSAIHQTWLKYVCGRLESRFRYSNDIVYNNFPWPENPSEKQKAEVEAAAQKVLDVRDGNI
ncbi:MAG: type IIL restriction-modification enzyme MmeI, partial [Bacteroidota bacterium]